MSEHHVTYRRAKDGTWRASVKGLRCRGRGRTLREARVQLRAKMAQEVADPYSLDFVEDVKLPGDARKLLVRYWSARRKAKDAARKAREAARTAAEALHAIKIGRHDAADLLGLSLARLQEVEGAPSAPGD